MKSILFFVFGLLFSSSWWGSIVFYKSGDIYSIWIALNAIVSFFVLLAFVIYLADNWNEIK